MPDNPLVSIIVSCYNKGQFLHEALQSVWQQTYTRWECIVVNDGSTDNSEEVAMLWVNKDPRFQYYYQPNKGVAAARNLGIGKSKGVYIQFLDADDLLEAGKLKVQTDFLLQNAAVDIVFGSSRYFIDGRFEDQLILNLSGDVPTIEVNYKDKHQPAALIYRNFATISATLYRREIFNTLLFRDIVFEDWYFHLECALANKKFHFERLEGSATFIRMVDQSQMQKHKKIHQRSPEVFSLAIHQLLEKYNYHLPYTLPSFQKPRKWKQVVKSFIPPVLLNVAVGILKKG